MARISKQQLIKLQAKYKTDDAIGNLFGITRQAVHQIRNKYDIGPLADKHADRNVEIARAYKSGTPGTKLARKFKMSVSQVYRIIRAGVRKRKK
jgi:hypothetical protein